MVAQGENMSHGSQKPICTICYEDLKPVLEDLQSIPLCGHVFHELCLQQWLEYCTAGKKPTCPVCKQSCSHKSLIRLYFQSTGADPTQVPSSQKPPYEADAEALAEEVRRLDGKLSSLTSSFQSQQAHLKELDEELSSWKELAKRETARTEEIKKEKECVERFLNLKMEELSRKSAECTKLEQRSLGLAKELAALKLATDLNLDEDEMAKLASLGTGAKPNNAVDVLRKSLALRNRSYKELMAQCNLLGRSETRALQQLDKAKEKIKKLKERIQELEKRFEAKENAILRDLKGSSKIIAGTQNLNYDENLGSPSIGSYSLQDQTANGDKSLVNSDKNDFLINDPTFPYQRVDGSGLKRDPTLMNEKENNLIGQETSCLFIDEDTLENYPDIHNKPSAPNLDRQNQAQSIGDGNMLSFLDAEACTSSDIGLAGRFWSTDLCLKNDGGDLLEQSVERNHAHVASAMDKRLDKDILNVVSPAAKKDFQANGSVAFPGDPSFVGGHFGLEGPNRTLGKWCRKVQTKANTSLKMQASTCNGGLIAVGADGRGGRVKVLRTWDDFLEGKAQTLWPKKHKDGSKQSSQFQIEHFFGKQV